MLLYRFGTMNFSRIDISVLLYFYKNYFITLVLSVAGATVVLALAACSSQVTSTPTRVEPTATDLVTETAVVTETLEATETTVPTETPVVNEGILVVRQDSTIGAYLVEENGKAVYVNLNDTAGTTSSCYDQCAETWIPVPYMGTDISTIDDTMIGDDVDVALLGTITRTDGIVQLTYDGWPLYTYVDDLQNGDLLGIGMDGTWYLISPEGEPLDADGKPAATPTP